METGSNLELGNDWGGNDWGSDQAICFIGADLGKKQDRISVLHRCFWGEKGGLRNRTIKVRNVGIWTAVEEFYSFTAVFSA
jgi:hypothetical protein